MLAQGLCLCLRDANAPQPLGNRQLSRKLSAETIECFALHTEKCEFAVYRVFLAPPFTFNAPLAHGAGQPICFQPPPPLFLSKPSPICISKPSLPPSYLNSPQPCASRPTPFTSRPEQ